MVTVWCLQNMAMQDLDHRHVAIGRSMEPTDIQKRIEVLVSHTAYGIGHFRLKHLFCDQCKNRHAAARAIAQVQQSFGYVE